VLGLELADSELAGAGLIRGDALVGVGPAVRVSGLGSFAALLQLVASSSTPQAAADRN
jgi:hypothetical protein